MTAWYNEIDRNAAAWLRELIAGGFLPPGDVDDRSIIDVRADDLVGYDQCHFFAGIGGWAHALRLAGWPDDRPVWTGSCPCQPISVAGQRKGHADVRHLWPAFFRLVAECKPATVFGEQVASKDGREWLAAVRHDLEAVGYACGAADLCAAGVGAPHIRQRLYFVADTMPAGRAERGSGARDRPVAGGSGDNRLADADDARPQGWPGVPERTGERPAGACGVAGGLADAGRERREGQHLQLLERQPRPPGAEVAGSGAAQRADAHHGGWRAADWLHCRDGKWRPVEPGTQPLAHGLPARMGRVCAACLEASAEGADDEDLRELRNLTVEVEGRLPAEILQSGLRMGSAEEDASDTGSREMAGAAHVSEPDLRELRTRGREPSPPQGWQPAEQRSQQHPDPVPPMPHSRAPTCERCGSRDYVYEVRVGQNRISRLRGYGNAIVPQVAAGFIAACMEALA